MDKEKVAEFIAKLSRSKLPEELQEHILNNLHGLPEGGLEFLDELLDAITKDELSYEMAIARLEEFYRSVSRKIHEALLTEAKKIKAEAARVFEANDNAT